MIASNMTLPLMLEDSFDLRLWNEKPSSGEQIPVSDINHTRHMLTQSLLQMMYLKLCETSQGAVALQRCFGHHICR